MKMTLTPLGLQVGDDPQQAVGLGQGQARGRLVHDDQPRVERQRLGDLDQLPLRERQLGDRRVRAEIDAEAVEQRLRRWRAASLRSTSLSGPPRSGSRPMKTLAATSRLSNRLSSWWTKAMPPAMASADGEPGVVRAPSMRIVPLVGAVTPPRIFISVDLPAPFSPTRPITSPRRDGEVDAVERHHAGIGLA